MKRLKPSKLTRVLFFCLIMSIFLSTLPVLAGNASVKDLDKGSSYARQAIAELFEKGVVTGDDRGNFNPGENITRGQMIAIIVRLLKLDTSNLPITADFKDVPGSHWAFPYVEAAYRKGIINGVSRGTFGVDYPCTREEMTVMFVRGLGVTENDIREAGGMERVNMLADGHKLFNWSREYVGFALSAGLMNGTGHDSFSPDEYAKREQAAVVASRFLNSRPDVKVPPSTDGEPADGELTIKEIAALEKSVVLITTYDKEDVALAQGSGFAVAGGLFLTNYHVLEGADKYTITDAGGKEYDIEGVVKYDADLDLAIIKSKELTGIMPLEMGSRYSLAEGDSIAAIGSPQGLQNSISQGKVRGFEGYEYGDGGKVSIIEITADVSHGSSGGPLFDMRGKVAGVVTAMSEDGVRKFAVAIDHAKGWIDQLKARPFGDLKVLDMTTAIRDYWKILDDEVKDTIYESFQAIEEEDVDAYMDTIHKLNPAYKTIRETYGKLFSIYDFDYTVQKIELRKDEYGAVTAEVTYTVKRTGKKESVLIGANGYYKLAVQGGRWKIFYAAENLYFPEGGRLTGADLVSE